MRQLKKSLNKKQLHFFFFILIITFFKQIPLQAQSPCFDAAGVSNGQLRGCVPFTINVTECTSGGVNLRYKYDENEGFVTNTSYTYTEPGVYSITQVGSFSGSGDSLRKDNYIEVLPTTPPSFFVRICAGREVVLNLTDNNYEEYIINWGDGVTQTVPQGTSTVNHNYTTSSSRSITVTGNYVPGGCGGSNAVLVTPLNSLSLPEVSSIITTTEGEAPDGSTSISFITDENYNYQIQRQSTSEPSYQLITTVIGSGELYTFENNGLNTAGEQYCYRVVVIDRCGNNVTSTDFCTINLEASAENNQNRITWTASSATNFQKYILYRNGTPLTEFTSQSTTEYVDVDVLCKEEYCYSVVAVVGTLIQTNIQSDEECVTSFSEDIPPAVTNINSTVEGDDIIITWDTPPLPAVTEYIVSKTASPLTVNAPAETTEEEIIKDSQNNLIDEDLSLDQAEQRFCYEITYINVCEVSSVKSVRTCPVILQIEEVVSGDNLSLEWTDYQGGTGTIQGYVLEKLDKNGNVYTSEDVGFMLNYTDEGITQDRQVLRYRVRTIIDEANGIFSYSNIQEYRQPYKIFFPNAFTPDGDGLNDIFEGKGLFIQEINLVVYTRSGEQVFSAENLTEGWDGNWNGSPAPADVYVYMAEVKDYTGQSFTASGTFTLIR